MTLQSTLTEAGWEALALELLGEENRRPLHGEAIAPGAEERNSWCQQDPTNKFDRNGAPCF